MNFKKNIVAMAVLSVVTAGCASFGSSSKVGLDDIYVEIIEGSNFKTVPLLMAAPGLETKSRGAPAIDANKSLRIADIGEIFVDVTAANFDLNAVLSPAELTALFVAEAANKAAPDKISDDPSSVSAMVNGEVIPAGMFVLSSDASRMIGQYLSDNAPGFVASLKQARYNALQREYRSR